MLGPLLLLLPLHTTRAHVLKDLDIERPEAGVTSKRLYATSLKGGSSPNPTLFFDRVTPLLIILVLGKNSLPGSNESAGCTALASFRSNGLMVNPPYNMKLT